MTPLIVIKAIDKFPEKIFLIADQLQMVKKMKQSEIGNFPGVFNLRIGIQVMKPSDIKIDDRLVNIMFGQVVHFFISNGHMKTVHLRLDDVNISRSTMQSNFIGR